MNRIMTGFIKEEEEELFYSGGMAEQTEKSNRQVEE